MKTLLILFGLLGCVATEKEVYRFYQTMQWYHESQLKQNKSLEDSRRTDSPTPTRAKLKDFPFVCLLNDVNWLGKCTGTVIAPRWVLTAAHCLDGTGKYELYYITYNTEFPYDGGDFTDILRTFFHPGFQVVREQTTKGVGVAKLFNDVGLARSGREMQIKDRPPNRSPLQLNADISFKKLNDKEVKVYGFSRTKTKNRISLEMIESTVKLQDCAHAPAWFSCICGGVRKGGTPAEICFGDSGGPVVHDGIQIGIVSMGPIECATRNEPSKNSTSVITLLSDYITMINATIRGVRGMEVMQPHRLTDQAARNVNGMCIYTYFTILLVLIINF